MSLGEAVHSCQAGFPFQLKQQVANVWLRMAALPTPQDTRAGAGCGASSPQLHKSGWFTSPKSQNIRLVKACAPEHSHSTDKCKKNIYPSRSFHFPDFLSCLVFTSPGWKAPKEALQEPGTCHSLKAAPGIYLWLRAGLMTDLLLQATFTSSNASKELKELGSGA